MTLMGAATAVSVYVITHFTTCDTSLNCSVHPFMLHHSHGKKKKRWSPFTLHRGAFGWQEVQLLLFLDLGTRRGWVVSITPRPPFTPGGRAPGTHCIGGWVGPRAGLDAEVRGKILCLCRGSNSDRPVRSQLPGSSHDRVVLRHVVWDIFWSICGVTRLKACLTACLRSSVVW
jgi:hypothetical protein